MAAPPVSPTRSAGGTTRYSGRPSPSPSRSPSHHGQVPEAGDDEPRRVEGEADVAEIDLGSWDLPESFIVRPALPAVVVKPALAQVDRRALRKGRTVSFHGFPTDDPVEELGDDPSSPPPPDAETETERRERPPRPRSSASIMARGRPTSPFRTTDEPPSIEAQPRNVPSLPDAHDPDEVNPFTIPPPAGPKLSRFDPKATPTPTPSDRALRPTSTMSGSFSPPPPPITSARIRPRTLIMPTPLQGSHAHDPRASAPPLPRWDTESFKHGAKPLPPGALTRPDSFVGRIGKADVFRITLDRAAGLQPAGAGLPSATVEGEMAVRQYGGDDQESEDEETTWDPDDWRPETRTVGGLSLMDRLEARKRELKGKNRCARVCPPPPTLVA